MAARTISPRLKYSAAALLLAVLFWQGLAWAPERAPLSDAEFQTLALELSEPPGYFPTDNLLSNETSYLHVAGHVAEAGDSGDAYVGVGPEQNFTYIAHARPALAFIVDIRRDARLQHLYYKHLFERAADRWQFLSLLLSRPLPADFEPDQRAGGRQLVDFFKALPASQDYLDYTSGQRFKELSARFPELVSELDRYTLQRIANSFYLDGLSLTYRMGRGRTVRDFPSLGELITETSLTGEEGHFLSSPEHYAFLRQLQLSNRVIPVIGNFAGRHALRSVGRYLRDNGYQVSVFYTSNVEFYLFRQGDFGRFMRNVKALPFSDRGVVVRSFFNFWYGFPRHPDAISDYYVTSLAQRGRSLIRQHDLHPYLDYWDLVTRDYLPPTAP